MIYLKHQWVQILAARVRGPAEGPYYVWGQSTKLFVNFSLIMLTLLGVKFEYSILDAIIINYHRLYNT